ncbi:MAG: efflux RND transporter periplasmic adaptor subunit [Opitutaceae bacterium]|jgi:RND family efflux transporter MFP subunit|nr:efflux RND transporter periplasmic adaptor subunit [Opitutaceae bacterium]
MRLKRTLIISGILAVLCAGGLRVYYQRLPRAVVDSVKRGTATRVAPANILVTESFSMDIKSETGGRILKSGVQLGQVVKAGDILYQIDTKDLELDIERTESEYNALKDTIALGSPKRFEIAAAEEALQNSTRLAGQGRISQQELDRAKRWLEQLKFQLANDEISNRQRLEGFELSLKTKRRALEKMSVTVANDGTISEIGARAGDLVGGGQVLCRVISKERLVQAQISEENFSGIRPGLPVNMQLLGYGGQQFKASVERVLPNADDKTRRYIAYLKVDIPEDRLVPGLTGEASITVDQHNDALIADRRALLGNSVFTVRDGRVVKTAVSTGFSGLGDVEILDGLKEGDEVIVDTPASFRAGQRVRARKAGES